MYHKSETIKIKLTYFDETNKIALNLHSNVPVKCIQATVVYCCSHCGAVCLFAVLLCSALCYFWFFNHIDRENIACCLTLLVFLVSCECYCLVALPRVIVVWSAVRDCGIT